MDFHVQQTPKFGLSASVEQKTALTPSSEHVEHIEKTKSSAGDSSVKNDHKHRQHIHLPSFRHHQQSEKPTNNPALDSLPFISARKVGKADGKNGSPIWIVIDDVVYDVTEFVMRHPGGAMPLMSFAGKSCSWQFHKIHSQKTIDSLGRELRIGKTSDVPNPYEEPKASFFNKLWKSHQF